MIIKNIFCKLGKQHGITLAEILIVAVITVIITTAAIRVYLTQHESYLWQQELTDMNLNAQFAMDELTRRIANIGYGMPDGPIVDTNGIDIITNCIISGTSPRAITIISKTPGVCGLERVGLSNLTGPLECYGYPDSSFVDTGGVSIPPRPTLEVGDYAVVSDPTSGKSEIFQVSQIGSTTRWTSIYRIGNWAMLYPGCSYVTKIEYYTYYLDTTSHKFILQTQSDPDSVVIAENVDSLNFTYIYRLSGGETALTTPILNIPPEMVNVKLTVRTKRMKKNVYGNQSMDSTNFGGYSYKNISSTIKIRNRGYKNLCH